MAGVEARSDSRASSASLQRQETKIDTELSTSGQVASCFLGAPLDSDHLSHLRTSDQSSCMSRHDRLRSGFFHHGQQTTLNNGMQVSLRFIHDQYGVGASP